MKKAHSVILNGTFRESTGVSPNYYMEILALAGRRGQKEADSHREKEFVKCKSI